MAQASTPCEIVEPASVVVSLRVARNIAAAPDLS